MREIKIKDKVIGFKASPLSLLFYKQQFKSDLMNDLIKMKKGKRVDLDTVAILQIAWALNKTYLYPKNIPSFITWMENLGTLDIAIFKDVLEEAQELFVEDNHSFGSNNPKKKR